MDLTTMPQSLFDKIVKIPAEKISRSQRNILEAIIGDWQQYCQTSLTSPMSTFPEPDVVSWFELYDTSPGSPDNHIDISWSKRAMFHIEGSLSTPDEAVCIIYTIDSRNRLSPPMHFRIKKDATHAQSTSREDWEENNEEKTTDFQLNARALSLAIKHVLQHIDLFKYQDNFDY